MRQGLRIQKLEKALNQAKKKLEGLNEDKSERRNRDDVDEGKKNEEVDVNDTTKTATFRKSKSNVDKDAEDLIRSLKRV